MSPKRGRPNEGRKRIVAYVLPSTEALIKSDMTETDTVGKVLDRWSARLEMHKLKESKTNEHREQS